VLIASAHSVSRNNVHHEILRRKFRTRHPKKPSSHPFRQHSNASIAKSRTSRKKTWVGYPSVQSLLTSLSFGRRASLGLKVVFTKEAYSTLRLPLDMIIRANLLSWFPFLKSEPFALAFPLRRFHFKPGSFGASCPTSGTPAHTHLEYII
jgi:hypothetical protein